MYTNRKYREKIQELTRETKNEGLEALLYARFLLRMIIIVGAVVRNSKCWTVSGIERWESVSNSSENKDKGERILGCSLHDFKKLTDDERFYIGIQYIVKSILDVLSSEASESSVNDLVRLSAIAMESDTAHENTNGLAHFVFRLTEQVVKLTRCSIDKNYQRQSLIQNDTCFISDVDGVMNGPFDAYCFEKINSDIDLVRQKGGDELQSAPLWDVGDLGKANVYHRLSGFLTTFEDLELTREGNGSSVVSKSVIDSYKKLVDGKALAKISSISYVSAENKEVINDRLARDRYVSALVKIVKNKRNDWNICIGLFARWGDGKTGLLSLLSKKLRNNNTDRNKYYIANFNAWAYQGAESIRAAMAHEIVKTLTTIYYRGHANESHAERDWFMISIEKIFGFVVEVIGVFINLVFRFYLAVRFVRRKSILKLLVTFFWIVGGALLLWVGISDFIDSVGKGWRLEKLYDENLEAVVKVLIGTFITVKSLLSHRKVLAQLYTSELRTYLELPSYAKDIGEVPQMSQDLKILCGIKLGEGASEKYTRRLVVIVDDLDRCEPDCIVKVFEAIKLVMDIPNVIVIISMDHRIALSALSENYQSIESYHELGCARSIARDYLGKIINYSICLPPLSSDNVKAYIAHLIEESEAETSNSQSISANGREKEINVQPEVEQAQSGASQNKNKRNKGEVESKRLEEETSEVEFVDRDIERSLADWAIKLGINNPRQIKRLYNSYHMMINIYPGEQIGPKDDGAHTNLALLALMLVEKVNSEASSKVRSELWKYLCDGPTVRLPSVDGDSDLEEVIKIFHEKISGAKREEILTKASQFVLPYC
ncbi:KAP family P-loop NTPase fold protein [Saccharophagus degradans]|uniref:P-loop NTPase fold protein n=1 Tax=Saccharophagus degradans TaxID=86304 RepID=A0AAW7X7X8_9GAMM|nr:P-loop NTPase fold protein [Saccharophagus degradans]MDO6423579.1 P-loop NTPase fold protein [Saccharophagus degradans]MDO6607749.1 P-loop NTPase fold protein [Saccharophagus degradans]